MGRNVTIKGIAIPVPSGDGKNLLQDCRNFIVLERCYDAIGLLSIRFALAKFALGESSGLPYYCPGCSSLNSRYSAISSLNARATTLRLAPDCSPVSRGKCWTSTSFTFA
jgi:hypothetical protein